MGLEPFTPDSTIFQDENVLRDGYQPDTLIERDRELEAFQSALRPVVNGAQPKNLFLYGQTGVGKTLATSMVLDRLASDLEPMVEIDLETIFLNCKSLTSSYQVAAHLVNEFRPPDEQIKTTGYPSGMINKMLWSEINALDATHCLIVLDEVDSIGNDDDILYQVPRANDNGHVDETQVGVIGISNDFTFRDNLSARVKDSLCDEEILFSPYDANELRRILEQRAEQAFHPGVLEDGVVGLAAAFAAQSSGSARQALRRLYKAGDLARDEGTDSVVERHIRAADEAVERDKVHEELVSVPVQSKLTLYALLTLEAEEKLPAKRSAIYKRYRVAAQKIGADVRTDRTVHDRLSQLTLKGFLDVEEKNKGPKGGSYYEYQFSIRTELVREALQRDSRMDELFN
ncbi:Cdc6/Cdc18 family protein [Natronorubrum tibetense]|uniref:ORC1-type DNA replication protein n=1 Tax=Natronorubrum tibetense GA33 TaxID=1114856 RepID=L9VKZ3_9EURY|nr:orc1/cdc6 family replication initiation protein [Natronorubrum tibetense]ELY37736.1 cell division control protein 6 [Natronorubrum tibetense GA33]